MRKPKLESRKSLISLKQTTRSGMIYESGKAFPDQDGVTTPKYANNRTFEDLNNVDWQNCVRNIVKFEKSFSSLPEVIITLPMFPSPTNMQSNFNIEIATEKITTHRFEIIGCTWNYSRSWNYFSQWTATESSSEEKDLLIFGKKTY